LVFGKTFEEYLERLDLVLTAIEDAGLTINPRKCVFATDRVLHLGHIIDADGIRPNPNKVSALSEMVVKNVKTLRSFIGVTSFFRKFVPQFSTIAQSLFNLLKKNVPWSWNKEQEEAKAKLVDALTSAPILAHFDEELEVVVQTDASQEGLGAVLLQDAGNGLRPVSYISPAEKKQHCNELECLALVWALEKLRPYLYGKRFTVETDSLAVKSLMSKKDVGKFGRWVFALQEFNFEIRHIRGVDNCIADGLSRNPLFFQSDDLEQADVMCFFLSKVKLPSGLQQNELRFQQKVDPPKLDLRT
jgi:ribonuclease HI